MSGSSGHRGGGSTDDGMNCSSIAFAADLNSVQSAAIKDIEVGQRLPIILRGNTIAVLQADGEAVVGTINWARADLLANCIADGYEYSAQVRSVDDGLIKVYVSMVRRP